MLTPSPFAGWSAKMGEPKDRGAQTERQALASRRASAPGLRPVSTMLRGEDSPAALLFSHIPAPTQRRLTAPAAKSCCGLHIPRVEAEYSEVDDHVVRRMHASHTKPGTRSSPSRLLGPARSGGTDT